MLIESNLIISEPYERIINTISANPKLASHAAKVMITKIIVMLNWAGAPKVIAAKIMVIRVMLSRIRRVISKCRRWRTKAMKEEKIRMGKIR